MRRPGKLASIPWHLLLAPAVPLLIFLRGSASGATPRNLVWPYAALLAVVLPAWVVLAALLRDARRSALMVSLLALAGLGYSAAAAAGLVAPLYLAVLAGVFVLWRSSPAAIGVTTAAANGVLLAATVALGFLVARDEMRTASATALEVPVPLALTSSGDAARRPDIYVVILEGYARADVLRETYGFENPLVGELRSLGFFVADRAAGNYPQMGQSLASALNLEYLPALLDSAASTVNLRRRLGELITHNRLFAALRSAGYTIRAYETEYAFLRPEPADERPGPLLRFTNFEYRLYEASVVPRILQTVGLPRGAVPLEIRRRHIAWVLDRLPTEPSGRGDRPAFVFVHLLMPHPPFTVGPDGSARQTRVGLGFNDGDHWQRLSRGSGERYEAGYLDAVKYLNARVPALVRALSIGSPRPAIVYVLSNHGPASRLRWEQPDAASIRERMGILFAARFPDGDPAPLHSAITPVNAYRVLLNRALGGRLPLLEDRSYFSTWERLGEFGDVTDRVR